ncbi:helix-turn-helix domain-containing protein, partial [Clavibacter michiganensis]|uniref:helix-turn-helix domain-containing protein n=1 Tax=Clavibacter michiganensis TaxID=28447 RepID=UPI00292F9536
ILTEELGAGPKALSRAHRAQTARTLLTSSDLPVADVAFASGFSSVRQFNDTVREVFALTPSELRARRADGPASADDGWLHVHLPARPPFDLQGLLDWHALHALAGLEQVERNDTGRVTSYGRLVDLPGGPARFTASASATRTAGPAAGRTGIDLRVRLTT